MHFCNWRWGRYQRTLSYVTLTVIWLGHGGLPKLGLQGGHKLAASQGLVPSLRGSAHLCLQPYSSVHLKFCKIKKKKTAGNSVRFLIHCVLYKQTDKSKGRKTAAWLVVVVVAAVIKRKQLMKLVFSKAESSFGIYQGAKTTLAFSLLWSVCYYLPLSVMQITPPHYLL